MPLKNYSRSLGEKLLVPAICQSIHDVLAMWANANSSYTGNYPLIVPLLPMITVSFSFFLKLASLPSIHICILISIISGTSLAITGENVKSKFDSDVSTPQVNLLSISSFYLVAVSQGLAGFEPLEYMYAFLALMLFGLCLNWLVKAAEEESHQPSDTQSSIFDIYYVHLVNQSWILGLLWLLHPDNPWQVLSHSSWHSLLFHGYQLAILLLGMVLNFVVSTSALCISPLAASLLHSAKSVAQPFFHLL